MSIYRLDRRGFDALAAIYDAALDASRWGAALDVLCAAAGAKGAALMVTDAEEAPYSIQALSSLYDGMVSHGEMDHYMQHLAPLEHAEWQALARQPPRQLICDDEVGAAEEMERRPDYRFLRAKLGMRRRFGVRLNANAAWYDAATFCFDESLDRVPPAARRLLGPLLPHYAKAVEMGRAFERLRARYGAVLAALDRVHVGLGVGAAGGEVVVTNAEADRILGEGDGIALGKDGRLLCRDPDQTALLQAAIAEAALTAAGEADRYEVLTAVPRPSGRHPVLVEVAPLSDREGMIGSGVPGALVTLIDPEHQPTLQVDRFARLHGLTEAETDVCGWMVAGLTSAAIAERRNTALETVKCQISSVLSKAGVRRRSDLIRLVVRTLPPIG